MEARTIEGIRKDIDDLDRKLHELLSQRCQYSTELGKYKKENSLNIVQLKRWKQVINNRYEQSKTHKIDTGFITKIYNLIHEESVRIQEKEFEK